MNSSFLTRKQDKWVHFCFLILLALCHLTLMRTLIASYLFSSLAFQHCLKMMKRTHPKMRRIWEEKSLRLSCLVWSSTLHDQITYSCCMLHWSAPDMMTTFQKWLLHPKSLFNCKQLMQVLEFNTYSQKWIKMTVMYNYLHQVNLMLTYRLSLKFICTSVLGKLRQMQMGWFWTDSKCARHWLSQQNVLLSTKSAWACMSDIYIIVSNCTVNVIMYETCMFAIYHNEKEKEVKFNIVSILLVYNCLVHSL